jgi:predicted ATP-grasp superfamily ATP-dependent carboligase
MITLIKENCSFQGKLLLVSAVSAGDVPTFALDQLIVSNEFKRVAFFYSEFIEPYVGYLPQEIEGGALGLPGELYMRGDILILQFRSSIRFGRKKELAKEISAFAKANDIKDVVVLASLPYSIKQDSEIIAK